MFCCSALLSSSMVFSPALICCVLLGWPWFSELLCSALLLLVFVGEALGFHWCSGFPCFFSLLCSALLVFSWFSVLLCSACRFKVFVCGF
jgi:hypothetical protein